jgi:GGDEF domain-containing protein
MNDAIWLHWFPIALGVGIACGLAGPKRSRMITFAGAAYWLTLAISLTHGSILKDVATLWSALGGAAVIGLIGFWVAPPSEASPAPAASQKMIQALETAGPSPVDAAADVLANFDAWLTDYRGKPDPWPDFGEFLVSAIHSAVGGKHVRVYRLMSDGDQLHPLRKVDLGEPDFLPSRGGIVGHVVTTGKSYYAGDPAQGELVQKLADDDDADCIWCFAIRVDRRTIGIVRVGDIEDQPEASLQVLRLVESVVALSWITLTETCRGRLVGHVDPVAGVLTQSAFMKTAVRSLQNSYSHGEPVAVVNINIEGMRRLHDAGQWDQANALIHETSSLLMQRIRQDDEIGVFDSSRFLILLRRVDSELATLIVSQLMEKLTVICADQRRWGCEFTARCGVAGSGTHQPSLHALVTRATENAQKARETSVSIISDLCQPVREREAVVA